MIIMDNRDYWSIYHIKLDPKNTVTNMKHLKYSIYLTTTQKYSSCEKYPKKYRFSKYKTPKKYSADPCL